MFQLLTAFTAALVVGLVLTDGPDLVSCSDVEFTHSCTPFAPVGGVLLKVATQSFTLPFATWLGQWLSFWTVFSLNDRRYWWRVSFNWEWGWLWGQCKSWSTSRASAHTSIYCSISPRNTICIASMDLFRANHMNGSHWLLSYSLFLNPPIRSSSFQHSFPHLDPISR